MQPITSNNFGPSICYKQWLLQDLSLGFYPNVHYCVILLSFPPDPEWALEPSSPDGTTKTVRSAVRPSVSSDGGGGRVHFATFLRRLFLLNRKPLRPRNRPRARRAQSTMRCDRPPSSAKSLMASTRRNLSPCLPICLSRRWVHLLRLSAYPFEYLRKTEER